VSGLDRDDGSYHTPALPVHPDHGGLSAPKKDAPDIVTI
jgi:hypothetical protein